MHSMLCYAVLPSPFSRFFIPRDPTLSMCKAGSDATTDSSGRDASQIVKRQSQSHDPDAEDTDSDSDNDSDFSSDSEDDSSDGGKDAFTGRASQQSDGSISNKHNNDSSSSSSNSSSRSSISQSEYALTHSHRHQYQNHRHHLQRKSYRNVGHFVHALTSHLDRVYMRFSSTNTSSSSSSSSSSSNISNNAAKDVNTDKSMLLKDSLIAFQSRWAIEGLWFIALLFTTVTRAYHIRYVFIAL